MKITRKIIALLMVVAMFAVLIPATFAAGSGAGTYKPGATVKVSFLYAKETGVQGTITFSNPAIFAEDVNNLTPTITGTGTYNPKEHTWMGWLPQAGDIGIAFNLTIKDGAKEGDTCVITHTYEVTINDGMDVSETRTESVTIKVGAADPKPDDSKPDDSKPDPKPNDPKIDYTELLKQIGIAQGLDEKLYTDESWEVLEKALKEAKAKRSSKSQKAVDAAAQALKDAIAALVEMDYSALLAAMDQANKLAADNELAGLFQKLCAAMTEAKRLLNVGDQDAVDAITAEIIDLLAQITAKMEELGKSEIIEVEKEVPVEVMPSGEFCNIPMHKVWPILFWISLALNGGFIAFFVIYFAKKKKNRTDTTPLVDYDISDDEV